MKRRADTGSHGIAIWRCVLLAGPFLLLLPSAMAQLCCSSNIGPGCNNPGCQATICLADPFCCNVAWDAVCANAAVANANASGPCAGVSNCPGQPPGPCAFTQYTVTITSGTFPGEVSWQLIGPGGVAGAGGAPITTAVCLEPGCYTMHMYDSWGDGWNGATFTVRVQPSNAIVGSGTLATGTYGATMLSLGAPCDVVTASDCAQAVNVCTDLSFMIDPNGAGSINEIPPLGSVSNPDYGFSPYNPWGTFNMGCLRGGELNSTWMVVNIWESGWLEFSFGGLGTQAGYYDWAMWPYDPAACTAISGNTLPPVRCNWNGVSYGGTGLAGTLPLGGDPSNYEPPIWANEGEQYIICFSNWSSVTTSVPLVFNEAPGNAVVDCQDVTLPLELVAFEVFPTAHDVLAQWTTLTEVNTAYFVVERSNDMDAWAELAVVDAAGHSVSRLDYGHVDPDPMPGTNYYRLRMVDADGTTTHSPVREVQWGVRRAAVFPNPSADGRIRVVRRGDHVGVDVFDGQGRQVPYRLITAFDTQVEIDLGAGANGLYTVRIGTDRSFYSERVVVGR